MYSCSEQLASDLWNATRRGQLEEVRDLLSKGADPNSSIYNTYEMSPPLHRACEDGNLPLTKVLVEEGKTDTSECSQSGY